MLNNEVLNEIFNRQMTSEVLKISEVICTVIIGISNDTFLLFQAQYRKIAIRFFDDIAQHA